MDSHVWQIIATTSIGIIATSVTFWASIIKNIVSKAEILSMIENHSPYIQDKQFIMDKLASNKEMLSALASALQKNSEVMTELKLQIMVLAKTLEALEKRIENE